MEDRGVCPQEGQLLRAKLRRRIMYENSKAEWLQPMSWESRCAQTCTEAWFMQGPELGFWF